MKSIDNTKVQHFASIKTFLDYFTQWCFCHGINLGTWNA